MVRRIRKRVCGLIILKKLVYLISPNKINQNFYESLDKVLDVYRDAAQDFPGGKIERDFISQIAPEGKRDGGVMSIFDMIQPINAQR